MIMSESFYISVCSALKTWLGFRQLIMLFVLLELMDTVNCCIAKTHLNIIQNFSFMCNLTTTCSQHSARERLRPEVHDLVNRRKQVNQPQWYALLFVPGPGEHGCWSHLNKHTGRTDRLINATSFRWMAHLFVHPRLPVLLSLPTALFFF